MAKDMGEAVLTVKVKLDEESLDEVVKRIEERLGGIFIALTLSQEECQLQNG